MCQTLVFGIIEEHEKNMNESKYADFYVL